MELQDLGLDGRKAYFLILITGMIASVITFNMGYELIAAGITTAAVISLILVKRKSDRPVFDERDNSLAEESTHLALMWSGAFLGIAMIVISIGMGLGRWSYPEWAAPYYLSWGLIMALAIAIEVMKRYEVIE